MENEILTSEMLESLIDQRNVKEIRRLFEVVPSIDIADALNEIEDVKKLVFIFKTVKSEYTAEVFTELDSDVKERLIQTISDAQLAKILEDQFTDDLVDDIEEMPANLVTRILRNVPKERRADINRLLNYKENTAGSIMTTEFFTILDSLTVDEAIASIRKFGKDKETVYTLFVIDKKRNLVGTLGLDELIFAKGDELIKDIMNRDFVTVNVNDDQEEVANIVKRYDLNAVAVLNNENRLIGLVTVDDIVDVIEEEANEDIAALAHVAPLEDTYLDTPAWKTAVKCIPWIIVLLVLGTFTTMVLDKLQGTGVFTLVPILIAFVPTLMDTGGNAGGQTIALMIRGLATKEFTPKDFFKVIAKEALTALIVSSAIFLFSFFWFLMEQYTGIVAIDTELLFHATENIEVLNIWKWNCWSMEFFTHAITVAGTVSLTLFAGSFIAKIVAVCLPLTVAALKKDPAIVAQPLLTTFVDVLSLLAYLGIATLAFKITGLI